MRCLLCGGVTDDEPDARLPLLRIVACSSCRDSIAYDAGWSRSHMPYRIDGLPGHRRLWVRFRTGEKVVMAA